MGKIMRLSKKEQWESRWSKVSKNKLTFDPEQPMFREMHRILRRYLSQVFNGKFLEVGAYPGKYLWYFYKYHGYEPWGVEYVESCAHQAQEMLDSAKIPAHMIVEDFFNLRADKYIEGDGWDLVASFGFVEHFDEPEVAVSKHLEVACPGGLVIVSVPNHAGWNGKIMRYVDNDKWKQHNCMSLDDLILAFKKA
jgi:SAM-dependent methyltransferase